ncbi:MAG: hypothetical protein K2X86_18270 [Cytophagaceae bacterium]|nr:hypothetical protein [Cytophagaceae bacterium]
MKASIEYDTLQTDSAGYVFKEYGTLYSNHRPWYFSYIQKDPETLRENPFAYNNISGTEYLYYLNDKRTK